MLRSPLRIAVIGAGSFGRVHLKTYEQLAREGRVVIVGAVVRSEASLATIQADYPDIPCYTDYRRMLAEQTPDAVSVATPDHSHAEIVCDCLDAGCHVLVEKPMDTTVAGCERMIARAREKNLLLEVDFHKRYDPYHRNLQAAVAEGQIGQPLYGYAWMEDRIELPRDHFPGWAAESSPMWFIGSHMLDLFRWVVGGPKGKRVFATGQKKKLVEMGIDTWDSIQAQIEFESGIGFSLNASWILPDGFEAIVNQGIRVIGTEGIAEIDSQNRGAEVCTVAKGQHTWNLGFRLDTTDKWGRPLYKGYGYEAIADLVENVEYLRGGGALADLRGKYPDGEDGLENARVLVAIHESLRTGTLIHL